MTPAEFKNRLRQKKISPLLVFVGEESFGYEELIVLLRDTFLDDSNRDFNFQQFSCRDAEIETVLTAARTYPFLAARRLLILRDLHELSAGKKALGDYCLDPAPETLLVMTAERLDKRDTLAKLLTERADWVEFQKVRDYQLPEMVRRKAAEKGRRFSSEALELFCHRSGTDLRRLYAELDKLFQFMGERQNIEVEDVVATSSEGGEASIFAFLNAVGGRKLGDSLVCLQEQLEDRAAPHYLLSMLARHFRQLWTISALSKQGLDKAAIAEKTGVNRFFFDTMQGQALNYSVTEMRQGFELLLETDRFLKTGGCSPAAVLESLLCRLIGRL